MAFGDNDLPALFKDLGVDVTLGATTVKGFVDKPDARYLDGEATGIVAPAVVVTVKTGALPGLAVGATLVADGVTYKVKSVERIDDGALTQIGCAKR